MKTGGNFIIFYGICPRLAYRVKLNHNTMKNSENIQNGNFGITIPKPCHEDWNKMTPDAKGAFCKMCCKSVHDFTKKTAGEIKKILLEEINAGKKVCGRFNSNQLVPSPMAGANQGRLPFQFSRLRKFQRFFSPENKLLVVNCGSFRYRASGYGIAGQFCG